MAENNGTMEFDMDFDGVPVRVGDKSYRLVEASGKAVVAYRNAVMASAVYGANGKPTGVRNLASVEPLLVSLCLVGEDNKPVHQSVIQNWPSRIQKWMFDKVKEMSDLEDLTGSDAVLVKALQRPDSPVHIDTFRDWTKSLPEEFDEVRELVKLTTEELAKNEQDGTTDGLD